MDVKRVAVVTGSNKGLGFAIVRGLCKDFDGDVILTARDESRGLAAVKDLEGEGLNPKFHQLDITDAKSIERLKDYLLKNYQGLDVLVNNAGILSKGDHLRYLKQSGQVLQSIPRELLEDSNPDSFGVDAAETIKINYTSQLNVSRSLFPLLRPHARVCNLSSFHTASAFSKCSAEVKEKFLKPGLKMDELSSIMDQFVQVCNISSTVDDLSKCSAEVKEKFLKPDLTMDELSSIMDQFLQACIEGTTQEKGFPNDAYGMSKVGLNVMTSIQQRELDEQGKNDIVVNCVSPGYVNTDMTLGRGILSIDEGAITPLMLCLLPPNITSPRGMFLREKKIVDWTAV